MTKITVSSGQSSSGLTISSGDTLQVRAGGVVSNTRLEQGTSYDDPIETVQGSSVSTQIDYGSETVQSGGSSLSAVVGSEGYQSVANGGAASFTTIQSGAWVDIGDNEAKPTAALAVATSDTVLSGGLVTVWARGVVSGTTVSAGGGIDVASGGQASGNTIFSGGVLFVESGGTAAHETIQAGGLIVERAGAVVTDTDTTGVLAGVVVTEDDNTVLSAWIQSGAALNNLDLSAMSAAGGYQELDAVVAAGQTVNGLILNSSTDLEIDGTVNGLTGGGGQWGNYVNIYQGGVLEGAVTGAAIHNEGGEVSGIVLTSGLTLNNSGGLAEQVTVQSGATLILGVQHYDGEDDNHDVSLPPAQASGTIVLSGGSVQVLSGGSIAGETISSGGFVYLSAGASASGETIADGGILIREGSTTVSNIHGSLAGIVVLNGQGVVQSAVIQSGTAPLSNVTLSLDGTSNGGGGTVMVGNGETVNGLTLAHNSAYTTVKIAGTVSGLSCGSAQITIMQGGVLGGTIARPADNLYGWVTLTNNGGTISGLVLTSGLTLSNTSGAINGLTVVSGATLVAQDMNMTGVVVQSGGTLQLNSATDFGSAGGTLDVGAHLNVGQNFSVTTSGSELIVSSQGHIVQTYTVDDAGKGSPILVGSGSGSLYGGSAYTLMDGQVVSAGQVSSGDIVSGGQVQIVSAGGTSLSTTVFSGGQETVYSGGVASATTVMSSGVETVSAGGSAVGTVVSSIGSETIASGGTATQTDVQRYGFQDISSGGSAVSARVEQNGTQIVRSGGTASATQVSGVQNLLGGQTVSSVVASGGMELIQSGLASATSLQSGSWATVSFKGTATETQVGNGGNLSASAGVVSSTQVQSGGRLSLSGGMVYAVVSNQFSQGVVCGSSVSATVQSGGMILVGSAGRATDDVISSGGYVEVQSGGVISNETVESGGIIILDNGGTVTGTNTSGVLAGVVVRDGQGGLISAITQSGDNTIQSLDLTSAGSAGERRDVLVASGETVNNLSVGNLSQNMYQNTLSIGGVVSGLAVKNITGFVLSGGTLEGNVSLTSRTDPSQNYGYGSIENYGGTVSGVDLGGGTRLQNFVGTASHVTVESGASFETDNTNISDILVKSGATLEVDVTSGNGQIDGTVDVGADFRTYVGMSGTIENTTLSLMSSGTVLERFNVALSSDAQPGETAIMLGSAGYTNTVCEGYVISAGQTSAGLMVPAKDVLQVQAGGTSVDATLSSGHNTSATEDVWGSSVNTHLQNNTQQMIESGGVSLQASVLNGATQTILSGGVASNTVLSGWFSQENVQSGGSAVSAMLSGAGSQDVCSGGTATGTLLASGGQQYLQGGSALDTMVASGGAEYIYQNSVASGSVIQSGGSAVVEDQGKLVDFDVESGGQLRLYGGTLQNGEVHSGGIVYFEPPMQGEAAATAPGTTLDLGAQVYFDYGMSGQIENSKLVLTSGGVAVESFAIGNLPANAGGETPLLKEVTSGYQTYYELDDGTPCYCPGTLIATTRGEVAVEDLKIGDRVVTAAGKRRPIRWIGNRAYSGRFAATNPDVLPVLFRAGSLGDGLPRRDLMVSPLHAMYLEGMLVPAQALVNGVSIVRLQQVERVEYFHIELKTHDILLAEGAPAESFVDDGSRGMFHNAHDYAERYPNERKTAVQYCAPRVEEGPQLEAIRQRLNSLPVARSAPVANAG